ncbi:MAG: hypothetical protein ABUT20_28390, partial [Bacteroidota bacterium]
MNFINYLFGTIAGVNVPNTEASFIPLDGNGNTLQIKGQDAQWWGLKRNKEMQKKAYEFCFPVSSVIDKLAEYDISGKIEIVRTEGKGKENFATSQWANQMNKLLAQP